MYELPKEKDIGDHCGHGVLEKSYLTWRLGVVTPARHSHRLVTVLVAAGGFSPCLSPRADPVVQAQGAFCSTSTPHPGAILAAEDPGKHLLLHLP